MVRIFLTKEKCTVYIQKVSLLFVQENVLSGNLTFPMPGFPMTAKKPNEHFSTKQLMIYCIFSFATLHFFSVFTIGARKNIYEWFSSGSWMSIPCDQWKMNKMNWHQFQHKLWVVDNKIYFLWWPAVWQESIVLGWPRGYHCCKIYSLTTFKYYIFKVNMNTAALSISIWNEQMCYITEKCPVTWEHVSHLQMWIETPVRKYC